MTAGRSASYTPLAMRVPAATGSRRSTGKRLGAVVAFALAAVAFVALTPAGNATPATVTANSQTFTDSTAEDVNGPDVATIEGNSLHAAHTTSSWLRRTIPRTIGEWGVVSVATSFVLLGVGAAISFLKRPGRRSSLRGAAS